MAIEIIKGNLLDGHEDAIILTVDGTKKGMEGNIARAFAKKYPDVWEEIEYEIKYPIALGQAKVYKVHDDLDCNNRLIIISATLHHIETLTDNEKIDVIKSAMHYSISIALRHKVKSIGSAIMAGGWRLEVKDALDAMINVYYGISHSNINFPSLHIYVLQKYFKDIGEHLLKMQINMVETDYGYKF